MRSWASTHAGRRRSGGGVTAAALLGAGMVDAGGDTAAWSRRRRRQGAPPMLASAAGGAERARDLRAAARPASSSSARRTVRDASRRRSTSTGRPRGYGVDRLGLRARRRRADPHQRARRSRARPTIARHVLRPARRSTRGCVGTDPDTDLALLRVDPDGPRPAAARARRLARPCRSATRRWRSATRSGSTRTLTTGVVSATAAPDHRAERLRRSTTSSRPTRRSTRATRAARCSTRRAAVIGINSQIATGGSGGGSVGIGFAVPIDTAKDVIPQLRGDGPRRACLPRDPGRAGRRRGSADRAPRAELAGRARRVQQSERAGLARWDRGALDGGRLRRPRAAGPGRGAGAGGRRRRSAPDAAGDPCAASRQRAGGVGGRAPVAVGAPACTAPVRGEGGVWACPSGCRPRRSP